MKDQQLSPVGTFTTSKAPPPPQIHPQPTQEAQITFFLVIDYYQATHIPVPRVPARAVRSSPVYCLKPPPHATSRQCNNSKDRKKADVNKLIIIIIVLNRG